MVLSITPNAQRPSHSRSLRLLNYISTRCPNTHHQETSHAKTLFAIDVFSSFSLFSAVSQAQPTPAQSSTKAPVTADDYLRRGTTRVERGNRKGAIEDFTKAIELNPRLVAAYKGRGFQHMDAAAYDLAIADLSKVVELEPKDANAFLNRGVAFQEKGDLDAALR